LLSRDKPLVQAFNKFRNPVTPESPMGRIDDRVAISNPAFGQTLTEGVASLGQLALGADQSTGPIQELQKIAETIKLKEPISRPEKRLVDLTRQPFKIGQIETSFDVDMNLGLW
jgi:hypothetical protein